jgi:choline dehydrogenase-like flavoprotein
MSREMEKLFGEMGASDVELIMPPSNSGHYMGGHRMGSDAECSTTDSYLKTHEVGNLYLASGGAFPTAGVSNPTLTTVALVLRMAEQILAS